MPKNTALLALLALAALLVLAAGAHASTAYFGPVKVTIGHAYELPLPGYAGFEAPLVFDAKSWVVEGDIAYHRSGCFVLVDPYYDPSGLLNSPAFVWLDDQVHACTYAPGACLRLSGHYNSPVGVEGSAYVVDQIATATCP